MKGEKKDGDNKLSSICFAENMTIMKNIFREVIFQKNNNIFQCLADT